MLSIFDEDVDHMEYFIRHHYDFLGAADDLTDLEIEREPLENKCITQYSISTSTISQGQVLSVMSNSLRSLKTGLLKPVKKVRFQEPFVQITSDDGDDKSWQSRKHIAGILYPLIYLLASLRKLTNRRSDDKRLSKLKSRQN